MRVLILIASLLITNISWAEKGQEQITLKVVEGKTFLVQVDESGDVIHKFMQLEADLDPQSDLTSQVEEAKKQYELLREREKDQIRFIAYDFLTDVVEPLALNHLTDLADHYNNSYANQLIITLGRRTDILKMTSK